MEDHLKSVGGQMNPEQTDKNNMTVAVLRIVKFMLYHGFYQNMEELMRTAEPVMMLLNGATRIKKPVTDEPSDPDMEAAAARKRYFPSSHSDPEILSKCIAADILLMVSNLEKEARCTIYLAKLKRDIEV
jgi:hypothetical protein